MNLLTTKIDLNAIAHNTRVLKQMAGSAKLMAVVKANAYNHGIEEVAPVIAAHGADAFGVATLAEAHQLRDLGIEQEVLCWIWTPEQDFRAALDRGIDLGVVSPKHARAVIATEAEHIRVTVKVETGLHRSGVDEDEWAEVFSALAAAPHVEVTGLFTHLSCADDPADPETDRQVAAFRRALALARELGLECPVNHVCNSPAFLTRADLHMEMVRPGLAFYGLEPVDGLDHGLQPAMSWTAKVSVVKQIEAGQGTSYGLTWRAEDSGYVAVVPAGYADGLPRFAQEKFSVTINGVDYPQVGRICMDQFVIFLGDNPHGVEAGAEAVIFGENGHGATDFAQRLGTINYEVVCRPTGRTVREYI
ncbi:alanine racemase [Corynebacterium crudilactis]|uniref:Alanine racemase n=1 Tax=Corynebacterium crudilactis TaxID=1652495 RepID=A0A172QRI0_9CORY|nr:alanine racemase [Corynebacterium crudilactis]ANE03281.1 alanine racemase [Corynebacterium crudilactis]